jgi:hypothetical protein
VFLLVSCSHGRCGVCEVDLDLRILGKQSMFGFLFTLIMGVSDCICWGNVHMRRAKAQRTLSALRAFGP